MATITTVLLTTALCYWSWPREPEVGGCAAINDQAELTTTDCTSPTALYRLAKHARRTHGCPPGDYLPIPRRGGRHHSGSLACYTLVVHKGDCLTTKGTTTKRTPCATADLKVDAVLTDHTDKHTCPDPTKSLHYSDPTTTICLSKP
ncbi:LppU/SCO3897 family protein [Umezawaea tangerina]|uniref:LppU/SCO3897 family protein n=1 Tax=Umezawaea tangerina TaxID=84725 RepID=UPI001475A58D|nr:hypothetical protein [Umezawaea tangerina]